MKVFNIRLLLLLFCAVSMVSVSFGQQAEKKPDKKEKKKVVIVTKKMGDDGEVITEKIVKEGEDAEMIFVGTDDHEIEMEKDMDVNVEVDEENGEKHIKIKIIKDGKPELIEWKGDGDMPAELREELKAKGINVHVIDGGDHTVEISSGNNFIRQPSACLGVRIGQQIEVENIDGEETTTETGTSEDGVPILDIIEDSGAEAAGLLADDVITAINGTQVEEIEDVLAALDGLEPGASVSVSYIRGGNSAQTNATLGDCGDAVHVEKIEKVIEMDSEEMHNGSDVHKKVIIKKRKGQSDEIIEVEGEGAEDMEFGGAWVEEFDNTLELEALDVFPNPTDGKVRVQFEAPAQPTIVKIVDLSGKEIYKEELNGFNGAFSKEINLSKAAKGALILNIQQGDKVFNKKLMLQ